MGTSKQPIRLRRRKMPTGNTSLYLDIYDKGKRRYEYLRLYLVPEKTRADKEKNRETLRLAEAVRAKRTVDFQNGRFGFEGAIKSDILFLEYFRSQMEKRKSEGSAANAEGWHSTLLHLQDYCSESVTFKDVTPKFVKGFKEHLDKALSHHWLRKKKHGQPLSASCKKAYFNKFRTCINQAVRDGIILINPLGDIRNFKVEEKECVYLTIEEVKKMAETDCKFPGFKRAFIFSCLTGLRKSDIEKMKWSEVREQGGFTRIVFKQKKTGGQEYIDINPQAVEMMGERGDPETLVFADFEYSSKTMLELKRWAVRAGITKDITFHTGRHTFAVMMLELGADIYTVQKLLGHKRLQTTEIYAKVLDTKKRQATMLIPPILPDIPDVTEGKE